MWLGRRRFLSAVGALVSSTLVERIAGASLARGLTLAELLRASAHAVVATPLDAHSEWAVLGGQRRIVTDIRVRIEDTLALSAPAQTELLVRVLGGIIGTLGERVDGQATLVAGKPSTLFLTPVSPVLSYVTGAAQGHYPLLPDASGVLRLRPSPHLPTLLRKTEAAVTALSGRTLAETRELLGAAGR